MLLYHSNVPCKGAEVVYNPTVKEKKVGSLWKGGGGEVVRKFFGLEFSLVHRMLLKPPLSHYTSCLLKSLLRF